MKRPRQSACSVDKCALQHVQVTGMGVASPLSVSEPSHQSVVRITRAMSDRENAGIPSAKFFSHLCIQIRFGRVLGTGDITSDPIFTWRN